MIFDKFSHLNIVKLTSSFFLVNIPDTANGSSLEGGQTNKRKSILTADQMNKRIKNNHPEAQFPHY